LISISGADWIGITIGQRGVMKKFGIIVLALTLGIIGMAMADPAIPPVNEIQGLSTSTTVIAAGNFNAASSVDLKISSVVPLTGIPGEDWQDLYAAHEATIYQSVYTEDTQNSDVGYISYDKDLDVSTASKISGQYNIQAVKQITYLGVDASSVVTNDYLLLDGAGWPGQAEQRLICPFAGGIGNYYAAFCNRVETGSSMNLKIANLNTQTGDRFIMKAADAGVEVFNTVGVSSYATDLPSSGSVSAYIRGSIREGGRGSDWVPVPEGFGALSDLYETVTFADTTGISGDISTFAKSMAYTSVLDTAGNIEVG
jgi:hypothetical protein